MNRWGLGVSYHNRTAHYCLEEASLFVFVLEDVIQKACEFINRLNSTVGARFCCHVHNPVLGWCVRRYKNEWEVPIDYDEAYLRHPELFFDFADDEEN